MSSFVDIRVEESWAVAVGGQDYKQYTETSESDRFVHILDRRHGFVGVYIC